jgi:hypothetical protein
VQNDPANCGGCGSACAAGQVCSAGKCGVACLGGSTLCSNLCVDVQNDAKNCGACGNACAAGQVCSAGKCGVTCLGGSTLCSNKCVDVQNDAANCGKCANACAAGQVCSAGVCGIVCEGGTTKCGNSCVNTQSDPANCGACGTACGAGKACVGGTCKALLLYTFSGVQTNVPIANLTGWSQCYVDLYNNSATTLATIQAACPQAQLLLGCRATGSTTLITAANAPRTDVLFDTGTNDQTTLHTANGVGWYFNSSWSWGYVQAGDAVQKFSCDVLTSGANDKRTCWHTSAGNINGGYRCGVNTGLNGSGAYERVIFQAP